MSDKQTKAIQKMRERYLGEYSRTNKKVDRITLLEEIRDMAAAEGAQAWEKFADAALSWLRKDMEAALSLFDEAIALDCEFAYPWHGKGLVLDDLNRYDEAIAAYDKAIAIDCEFAYPWNGKGNTLDDLKRYDEAMAAYDKAIAIDGEFVYPWHNKARVLYGLNRYDEAMSACDEAIAIGSEYASPHYGQGLIHWKQKRPGDAVKSFQRAIKLGLDPEQKEMAESWIARASRMVESKKAGKPSEESTEEDRSSDEALITELHEAIKGDLSDIEEKKVTGQLRVGVFLRLSESLGSKSPFFSTAMRFYCSHTAIQYFGWA